MLPLDYCEIGRQIRKYRKSCGLSQEALADAISISVTHMSHIETGNTKLSLPVLVAIAETLSVQTDALIGEKRQLTHTSATNEIAAILEECSVSEMHVIMDTIKTLKSALKNHM